MTDPILKLSTSLINIRRLMAVRLRADIGTKNEF